MADTNLRPFAITTVDPANKKKRYCFSVNAKSYEEARCLAHAKLQSVMRGGWPITRIRDENANLSSGVYPHYPLAKTHPA